MTAYLHTAPAGWVLAAFLGLLNGCSRSDVGEDCPQLLDKQAALFDSNDATVTRSQNIVAMGPEFEPCEQLVCIAAQGRGGYCSSTCQSDDSCPEAFVCQTVQSLGVFAQERFCVWKSCKTHDDCGHSARYCCQQIPGTGDNPLFKQCTSSMDGQCH